MREAALVSLPAIAGSEEAAPGDSGLLAREVVASAVAVPTSIVAVPTLLRITHPVLVHTNRWIVFSQATCMCASVHMTWGCCAYVSTVSHVSRVSHLYTPGGTPPASASQSLSWITPAPAARPQTPPRADGKLTGGR